MGRAPCCDKANVKRGPWSPEEDAKLKEYIDKHGTGGNWIALPQKAGLRRCGKSCRLRWLNYLRPNIRHGEFSDDEDRIISTLFANIGSRWSIIAAQLPGRTDNDIKNYWNTKLKKKLLMGSSSLIMVPPLPHKIRPQYSSITTYQPSISFLQSPSSSSSPPPYSSPSPHNTYNNNNNNNCSSSIATTARSPFTGNYYDYDPSSMSNITPSSANNQLLMHLHTQDGFVSPMQNYLYSQGKHSSPLIMFGDQAAAAAAANSCSSSDGSNCNNKDQVEHEQAQFTMFSTGNNIIDGNDDDDDVPEKQINGWLLNGIGDQTPLDYYSSSLEEIKQLISSSTTSNMISSCNSNLNFFVDDQNKTSTDHLQEAEKKSSFTSYTTDVD